MRGLASRLFAAYARNSGNNPDDHHYRNAAEQWMEQAMVEVGVGDLLLAAERLSADLEHAFALAGDSAPTPDHPMCVSLRTLDAAIAKAIQP